MSEHPDDSGVKFPRNLLAAQWWQAMQDFNHDGSRNIGADRGALARLRRASVVQAQTDEAVIQLYSSLWGEEFQPWNVDKTVRLALVLSHVRKNGEVDFGKALGGGVGEPGLKNLRFRQLLQARGNEEIVRQLRRAVAMLGNVAKVTSLASILLNFENDRARTRFAFYYFGALSQKKSA